MPKVSVVMPVYNTKEEYLREAIESILNQTFTDFEFIIINDGSTNNAEEVILSYKDERIKYFKQENKGLPKTRNFGLDIASSEYVAFADSDDISLPERLKKQVSLLDEKKDISVCGGWYETFPQKNIVKLPANPRVLDFIKYCAVPQPACMFSKKDFNLYKLKYNKDFVSAEDYELWSRAIKFLNFINIQEVLILYRRHETNITKKQSTKTEIFDKQIKQNLISFLTKDTKLEEKIKRLLWDEKKENKYRFSEQIFSVKNQYINGTYKFLRIFGLRIVIKEREVKCELN